MKLTWFEARQLRRFESGIRIDNFDAGINVFFGPNGSGKSTIIAALRAAFLERYQTKAVADLLPWANPGAQPTVQVHFEHNGTHYELLKQFLRAPFAVLSCADQRLDNANADAELADLLGFSHSAKGRNRTENYGVPGLLWIEQGAGQHIAPSLDGAGQYLREALGQSIGDLSGGDGDAVLASLRHARNEMLAVNTGKPKGEFDKLIRELTRVDDAVQELSEQRDRYREMVDQLGELRRTQRAVRAEPPWHGFDQQIEAARNALRDGIALQNRKTNLATDRQRLSTELTLIDGRTASRAQQEQRLAQRQEELARAASSLTEAQQSLSALDTQHQLLSKKLNAARRLCESLRSARDRQRDRAEHLAASQTLAAMTDRLDQARQVQARIDARSEHNDKTGLQPDHVDELRSLEQQMQVLTARREASSTQLEWELASGRQIQLDDETLVGKGSRSIQALTELGLGTLGKIRVRPPSQSDDQSADADTAASLEDRAKRLQQRFEVTSAIELEQKLRAIAEQRQEQSLLTQQLAMLAPDGIETLTRQQHELDKEVQALKARVDTHAGDDDMSPQLPLQPDDDAQLRTQQQELERCQREITRVEKRRQDVLSSVASARATHDAAQRELSELSASLNDPQAVQACERDRDARDLLLKQLDAADARIAAMTDQIQRANPDALEQDIERLTKSAAAARHDYDQNEAKCRLLEGRLAEAGASGLEERLALAQAEQARLDRQVTRLRRRADALNLLVPRLEQARQQATEQLQAPLLTHMSRYLNLLFPDAKLDLTEQLGPGKLQAADQTLAERGSFDQQSFGTREQLALVSRLAYADLLQVAGLPTLIILDDGLVHTDAERLAQMKRILFDASSRHQILIFTCHPNRWQDMGVSGRDIRELIITSQQASAA